MGERLSEPVSLSLLTNCLNNSILDNPLITLLGACAESGTTCWAAPITQLEVNTDAQVFQQGIKNLQNCWAWKQHIPMNAPRKDPNTMKNPFSAKNQIKLKITSEIHCLKWCGLGINFWSVPTPWHLRDYLGLKRCNHICTYIQVILGLAEMELTFSLAAWVVLSSEFMTTHFWQHTTSFSSCWTVLASVKVFLFPTVSLQRVHRSVL